VPTRLACGNAPTGSGARELSKDLLIYSEDRYQKSAMLLSVGFRSLNRKSFYELL
jgi:hypothetical protein